MKKLIRIFLVLVLFVHLAAGDCDQPISLTTEKKIVVMDQMDIVEVVYNALKDLQHAEVFKEETSPDWNRKAQIKAMNPDMVVLHSSCFMDREGNLNYLEMFIPFLTYMASDTRPIFLVYSSAGLPEYLRQQFANDASIEPNLISVFEGLDYSHEYTESLMSLKAYIIHLLDLNEQIMD